MKNKFFGDIADNCNMDLFAKIEESAIPEIEKVLKGVVDICVHDKDRMHFEIATDENLEDTKWVGKWSEWIRERLLAEGAPCVKVNPLPSLGRPSENTIYSVSVYMELRIFSSCAARNLRKR